MPLIDPFQIKKKFLDHPAVRYGNPLNVDSNILNLINKINFKIRCIGTFSCCGGHFLGLEKNVILTYYGYGPNENRKDDEAPAIYKNHRVKSEFKFPFITLIFLDSDEHKRFLNGLSGDEWTGLEKIFPDEFNNDIGQLRSFVNPILVNPENKMLLTSFIMDMDKHPLYVVTLTLLFRFKSQEQKFSPFIKDMIIKEAGTKFIKSIYKAVKASKLKTFKMELTDFQFLNCDCYYDNLCNNQKIAYFNRNIDLLKTEYDISITEIIRCVKDNLLPQSSISEEIDELFKEKKL